MKVLVTGAAGFIGSHVVDALVEDGHAVVGIDGLDPEVHPEGPPEYANSDARYLIEDLRSWSPATNETFEAVVHLAALGGVSRAARQPEEVIDANVHGTARLLQTARGWPGLRRLVLASSFSVYGANYTYEVPTSGERIGAQRRNEDLERGLFEVRCPRTGEEARILPITVAAAPDPLETYGASKLMQELCLRGLETLPSTILRFSSVYGSRMRWRDSEATIVARIAGWIAEGRRPELFEDGRQIRDWIWVGDVVEAVRRILAVEDPPAILNACSGHPTTLLRACRLIASAMGREQLEPRVVGGYRAGDMRHCLGDASDLTALLGHEPLAFADGVRHLLEAPLPS